MNYSTEILSGLAGLSFLLIVILGNRLRQRHRLLQGLEATQAELQSTHQSLTRDNQKLKEALELAKHTVESLGGEVQTLTEREASLSTQLSQAQTETVQVHQQLAELAAEKATVEDNYQRVQTEIGTLQAQKSTFEQELAATQATLSAIRADVETLEQQVEQATQASETETRRTAELDIQVAALTTDRDQLASQNQILEATLAQARTRIATLEQDLTTTIQRAEQAEQGQAQQSQAHRQELEHLNALHQERLQELQTRQAALGPLEQQVADLQATQQQLEQALETARAAQANATLTATERETTLAAELKQGQAELAQVRQQAQAVQHTLATVTAQKVAAEETCSQAQTEVNTLRAENRSLEEAIATSQAALSTLEARLSSLEQQVSQTAQSLEAATTHATTLERQMVSVNADRDRLAGDLQRANQTVAQLEGQVQTLQSALASAPSRAVATQAASQLPPPADSDARETTAPKAPSTPKAMSSATESVSADIGAVMTPVEPLPSAAKTETAAAAAAATAKATPLSTEQTSPIETTPAEAEATSQAAEAAPEPGVTSEAEPAAIAPIPAPEAVPPAQPLAGKAVVITGRLSRLSSQQVEKLIVEAGGKVTKIPSGKTGYIVVGENPGSKLKKAQKYNVPQLNEAQFLALLGFSPEDEIG